MPTDANGVYTLPEGYLAVTGATVLASQHNPPLEDLASSMTLRFMRSGVAPMTGALKGADGTVAAPGYTFNTAPSSGFYKTADGIGVTIGGAIVAEFTASGLRSGSRYMGELIPYSGLTAQPLTVFPVGQTLSRVTYAALWAFAQIEIAAGNTFYNNGDGSTTFGIGDLRGRVIATKDNLGGTTAGRLTSTYFGAVSGATGLIVGGVGGLENHQLGVTQVPNLNLSATGTATQFQVDGSSLNFQTLSPIGGPVAHWTGGTGSSVRNGTQMQAAVSVTGATTNGGGAAHNNAQPTIIGTHLLFAGA